MQALVKTTKGRGNMELREVGIPEISRGEVLIRVHACGICGSDIKIFDDQHPYLPPVVVGHEFSGEVVGVGAAVAHWQVGDRVVSEQHVGACGHCRLCLTGSAFACESKRAPGYFTDGAFTEYIKVPSWLLHRIPDPLSYVEAAFAEPSAVAVHGVLERTGISPEDTVLVLGCGPIGLAAARMAQLAGAARVIITGIDQDEKARLPKARELGIDNVVNVSQTDLSPYVDALTDGQGVDVAIELAGALASIEQAFTLARPLGRVGIIGQPPKDEIKIPYRRAMFRALKISFCYSSKFTSWEKALSMFARGAIKPAEFITHTLPLSDWEYGFQLVRSGESVKVVLEP